MINIYKVPLILSDDKITFHEHSEHDREKASEDKEMHEKYERAQEEKEKYKANWKVVFLDDLISKFEATVGIKKKSRKLIFIGEKFSVVCDTLNGSVRVRDTINNRYVRFDGIPSINEEETHFLLNKEGVTSRKVEDPR